MAARVSPAPPRARADRRDRRFAPFSAPACADRMDAKETAMRELMANSTGLRSREQRTHRHRARRLPSLALAVCASLFLASCGTAPSASQATGGVASSAPATEATPAAPSPSVSASGTAEAGAGGEHAPTPAPSGRELVRGSELTFTSVRNGYTVTVSADDWLVIETPGSWDGTFEPHQVNPDPGTDWIRDPGVATIEIGVLVVAPGTTLGSWEASEAPAVRMLGCSEASPAEPVTIAGTSVLLLSETCQRGAAAASRDNQYVLNAFAIHGTSALVAQWDSVQGHETSDRAAFLAILATWTWTSR